jgi:glyoxylate/hydroxypyruvate reductase A
MSAGPWCSSTAACGLRRELRAAVGRQPVVAPRSHRVGIAGLGTLGLACAEALRHHRLPGTRLEPQREGDLACRRDRLPRCPGSSTNFLSGCDTLVCLLPLTPQTRGFLDAATVRQTAARRAPGQCRPRRPPGRGRPAARAGDAASSRRPRSMPFRRSRCRRPSVLGPPGILVTPHIATRTDRLVIAQQTLDNLALLRRGCRPPEPSRPGERGY